MMPGCEKHLCKSAFEKPHSRFISRTSVGAVRVTETQIWVLQTAAYTLHSDKECARVCLFVNEDIKVTKSFIFVLSISYLSNLSHFGVKPCSNPATLCRAAPHTAWPPELSSLTCPKKRTAVVLKMCNTHQLHIPGHAFCSNIYPVSTLKSQDMWEQNKTI